MDQANGLGAEGNPYNAPSEPDPYWELGELRPGHLMSFAYQIASGMVREETATH